MSDAEKAWERRKKQSPHGAGFWGLAYTSVDDFAKYSLMRGLLGGEGGIRTLVGILSQTRFPGVRLKPLIHLSAELIVTFSRARILAESAFAVPQ